MALFTYIPSKVDIDISGYKVQGHTEVSFQLDNPQFTTVRGIRGKNTRVRSKNSSGVLTISLLQTSPTNDFLTDVLSKDLQLGTGRLVIKIKDNSGSSLFFTDEAYIAGFPALSFSDVAGIRTWTINCLRVPLDQLKIGGNVKPVLDLF